MAILSDNNIAHAIYLSLKDKSLAYVVKRFDRKGGEKINQEDFFQILGPKDKLITTP